MRIFLSIIFAIIVFCAAVWILVDPNTMQLRYTGVLEITFVAILCFIGIFGVLSITAD